MDWLPEWLSDTLGWLWVPATGALGGLMSAFHRASKGEERFWARKTLFGVMASSLLGGLSYGVLKYYGFSGPILGSLLGAIGFIGPKIIDDAYAYIQIRGKAKQ
jgi:CHASE2 domain-containing sensor protein